MPDLDMNTAMGSSEDYSDYEYQHFSFQIETQDEDNARSAGIVNFDPLQTLGGLDNNEVAELVGYELHATIEIEEETGVQNNEGVAEFRGNFGANLSNQEGIVGGDGQGVIVDGEVIDERSPDTTLVRVDKTNADDRIFQLFRADAGLPFSDANGRGGNASIESFHTTKNYRDLVGRGPVLDSTDDLSVRGVIACSDTVMRVAGRTRATLIWDLAEVSDAGRAFSVPDM